MHWLSFDLRCESGTYILIPNHPCTRFSDITSQFMGGCTLEGYAVNLRSKAHLLVKVRWEFVIHGFLALSGHYSSPAFSVQ